MNDLIKKDIEEYLDCKIHALKIKAKCKDNVFLNVIDVFVQPVIEIKEIMINFKTI